MTLKERRVGDIRIYVTDDGRLFVDDLRGRRVSQSIRRAVFARASYLAHATEGVSLSHFCSSNRKLLQVNYVNV